VISLTYKKSKLFLQLAHLSFLQVDSLVEPEGFEPSSKRGTIQVSTCLFCDWFSMQSWAQTPQFTLSL